MQTCGLSTFKNAHIIIKMVSLPKCHLKGTFMKTALETLLLTVKGEEVFTFFGSGSHPNFLLSFF